MGSQHRNGAGSAPAVRRLLALGVAVVGMFAAAVSGPGGPVEAVTPGRGTGPVDVLYAGSLVNLMEGSVGPAFQRSTGYTFNGFAGGSTALASEIKGGTQVADVFISASPSVNRGLQGRANGNRVSWYATFAASPLVIGYNKGSRFAAALRSKPWYRVVTEPGFLLGRTDPTIDPKGQLTVKALDRAAASYHEPALRQIASTTAGVFPEETLVGRLQAGQLDAGFFYTSETAAAHIPTVGLGSIHLSASYTITVVNRAPHSAAARAFLTFLLGRDGRALLGGGGLVVAGRPAVSGSVPSALKAIVHAR